MKAFFERLGAIAGFFFLEGKLGTRLLVQLVRQLVHSVSFDSNLLLFHFWWREAMEKMSIYFVKSYS